MTTLSSVLAWKISVSEESGGLQSQGSQKARHGLVNTQNIHRYTEATVKIGRGITGSKVGKECNKGVYFHSTYLTYM